MTVYPTVEDALERITQTDFIVRDIGLLASAISRPQTIVFGREVYPSLAEKFAALVYSLAENQALVDANKRLALGVSLLFLRLNDHRLENTHDELFQLMIDMAQGFNEVPLIARRLRVVSLPFE
jgi:death on curing protein